jgi:hypothetical protein
MVDTPVGTEWLGYTLLANGSHIDDPRYKNIPEFQRAKEQLGVLFPEEVSIWSNSDARIRFGSNQYRRLQTEKGIESSGKRHNFSSCKSQWLKSEFGLNYLNRIRSRTTYLQDIPFGACSEFIVQGYDDLKRAYNGSSVLIVGGGPSASDVDWNAEYVDHVWTCNTFYENPKFKDIRVDCAVMAPHMDLLENDRLMAYLERHPETSIAFETERGDYEKDWQKMYDFMTENRSRSFLYGVRYRSQLGITTRQICLAIFLGIKDIYIVGLDGQSLANDRHAFEGKKEKPLWFQSQQFETEQFICFWEYICELKKKYDFNIINLAEDLDYNMSSEITKWLESHS